MSYSRIKLAHADVATEFPTEYATLDPQAHAFPTLMSCRTFTSYST